MLFTLYIKDGTNNWKLFNTGMPKVTVCDLNIYYASNSVNSKLRAATWGRGLWESDLFATPPTANFKADKLIINVGETVNFTDLSAGSPTNWTWEFEQGSPETSNSQTPPSITYNSVGTYDVKLTVENPYGSDVKEKLSYIQVNCGPIKYKPINAKTFVNTGYLQTYNLFL